LKIKTKEEPKAVRERVKIPPRRAKRVGSNFATIRFSFINKLYEIFFEILNSFSGKDDLLM